jgi:hypothetical protein
MSSHHSFLFMVQPRCNLSRNCGNNGHNGHFALHICHSVDTIDPIYRTEHFRKDFESDCCGLQRQGINFVYPSSYQVQPGATPVVGMDIMDNMDIWTPIYGERWDS